MTAEQIVSYIMQYLPTIIAVIGVVFSSIKMLRNIKKSTEEIKNMKEMKEVQDQLKVAVQENIELRREICELITAYTGVKKKCPTTDQIEQKSLKG